MTALDAIANDPTLMGDLVRHMRACPTCECVEPLVDNVDPSCREAVEMLRQIRRVIGLQMIEVEVRQVHGVIGADL